MTCWEVISSMLICEEPISRGPIWRMLLSKWLQSPDCQYKWWYVLFSLLIHYYTFFRHCMRDRDDKNFNKEIHHQSWLFCKGCWLEVFCHDKVFVKGRTVYKDATFKMQLAIYLTVFEWGGGPTSCLVLVKTRSHTVVTLCDIQASFSRPASLGQLL